MNEKSLVTLNYFKRIKIHTVRKREKKIPDCQPQLLLLKFSVYSFNYKMNVIILPYNMLSNYIFKAYVK